MSQSMYVETFDNGPAGWCAWTSNIYGPKRLELGPSLVIARSPWWIDYNHAPPGAGYLHLLACLNTAGPQSDAIKEVAGPNRFIAQRYPTDWTDAEMTIRLRGELLRRGAEVLLLIQGNVEGICSGWMLSGQPIGVRDEWTEQTLTLTPDPAEWTALGSRHDRQDTYGVKPLEKVLHNIDANILLVLFPLDVVPMGPIDGDPHLLRAGHDYPVWQSQLPEGYVMLDEVRIQFVKH